MGKNARLSKLNDGYWYRRIVVLLRGAKLWVGTLYIEPGKGTSLERTTTLSCPAVNSGLIPQRGDLYHPDEA